MVCDINTDNIKFILMFIYLSYLYLCLHLIYFMLSVISMLSVCCRGPEINDLEKLGFSPNIYFGKHERKTILKTHYYNFIFTCSFTI